MAQAVYLLNDSVIGPLNYYDFAKVMARVRASTANLLVLPSSVVVCPISKATFW